MIVHLFVTRELTAVRKKLPAKKSIDPGSEDGHRATHPRRHRNCSDRAIDRTGTAFHALIPFTYLEFA
jgi:hypothetical protein